LQVTDDELRKNKVPVLVIVGSRDAPGRFEAERKSFGHAEFMIVEGAGHGSAPDSPVFVNDVRRFLARHANGQP